MFACISDFFYTLYRKLQFLIQMSKCRIQWNQQHYLKCCCKNRNTSQIFFNIFNIKDILFVIFIFYIFFIFLYFYYSVFSHSGFCWVMLFELFPKSLQNPGNLILAVINVHSIHNILKNCYFSVRIYPPRHPLQTYYKREQTGVSVRS